MCCPAGLGTYCGSGKCISEDVHIFFESGIDIRLYSSPLRPSRCPLHIAFSLHPWSMGIPERIPGPTVRHRGTTCLQGIIEFPLSATAKIANCDNVRTTALQQRERAESAIVEGLEMFATNWKHEKHPPTIKYRSGRREPPLSPVWPESTIFPRNPRGACFEPPPPLSRFIPGGVCLPT